MNHLHQAPENNVSHFEFFRKFEEIFARQGAPTVSTTPAANLATGTAGVVDTGELEGKNLSICELFSD